METGLRWRGLWWALGLVMAAAVVGLSLMPDPPQPMAFAHADKLEHGAAFAWLALWFLQLAPSRPWSVKAALLALGLGIETAQAHLPPRRFELADLVADGAGILTGGALVRTPAGRLLATLERMLAKRHVQA